MLKDCTWARGYKTFFMLNTAKHEILNAHKYKNIEKHFSGSDKPKMLFFLLIKAEMPTNGISTFMSRKNFMLSWVEHEKSFITTGPKRIWQLKQWMHLHSFRKFVVQTGSSICLSNIFKYLWDYKALYNKISCKVKPLYNDILCKSKILYNINFICSKLWMCSEIGFFITEIQFNIKIFGNQLRRRKEGPLNTV